MEYPKILSGDELVARGTTKSDGSLPEVGLKDVIPNGSWLEQKQIQSALEARKHIIEVERIEKCGVLSQADWHEELMLAEVTQKVGGHWQYLGHNVGKQLFLNPEEALFLMECNCLLLKHNEVTVSLQQAYSLLLRGKITIVQYKVYASLSRLGYKVFRHEDKKPTEYEKKINLVPQENKQKEEENQGNEVDAEQIESTEKGEEITTTMDIDNNNGEANDSEKDNTHTEEDNIKQEVIFKNETNIDTPAGSNSVAIKTENQNEPEKKSGSNSGAIETENQNEPGEKSGSNSEAIETENQNEPEEKSGSNSEAMETENQNEPGEKSGSNLEAMETENQNEPEEKSDTPAGSNSDAIETENQNEPKEQSEAVPEAVIEQTATTEEDPKIDNPNKSDSDIQVMEIDSESGKTDDKDIPIDKDTEVPAEENIVRSTSNDRSVVILSNRLHLLENRKLPPCNSKILQKCFENLPDLCQKHEITLKVPQKEFIPENVSLSRTPYVLNIEAIRNKTKDTGPSSSDSRPYSASEEVNGAHVLRVRGTSVEKSQSSRTPRNIPNEIFQRTNFQFRSFMFWRPQPPPQNFINFDFLLQRPWQFLPRVNPFLRPSLLGNFPNFNTNNFNTNFNPNNLNNNNNRNTQSNFQKRTRDNKNKQNHLEAIKSLAVRLKQLISSGNVQSQNIVALQRLIHTYNTRYKTRLRLCEDFEIINDETIVETIELDCEDESRTKRPRIDTNTDNYKENLIGLKQIAFKLKDLESKDKATARHRRAFSNLVKRFNKSYNADVYICSNYEVVDRKHINLDSSSDSDCVIAETPKENASSGKKLRNPFNILKRLSEKQNSSIFSPTISREVNIDENVIVSDNSYSESLRRTFIENWLPNENDFGRAEVVPRNMMYTYLIDTKREDYMFDFIKNQPYDFNNWLEVKISFLKTVAQSAAEYENGVIEENKSGLQPILGPKDCTDMPSVLKKLSIIKTHQAASETNLRVDFDVYNRDVQNFRKSNRPKPHFRVICVNESMPLPSGSEIAALHSKYDDKVVILFAIVGIGSVSYLQMNPTDLPVYIPNNDLDVT